MENPVVDPRRLFRTLVVSLFATACVATAGGGPKRGAREVPPHDRPYLVEIGLASWNIERFDAAGPGDRTFPCRTKRHLGMMADILLGTGADVVGLEEMVPRRLATAPSSLDQIVAEMNRRSGARTWKGTGESAHGGPIYTAILWNTARVDLVGKVTELTRLKRGYGFGAPIRSRDELRFARAPLAARFRVKEAPEYDFTVIVLHMKAGSTGLRGGLDENDKRRRGEWEDLLRKWVLKPVAQGDLRDDDLVVMGDMNERAGVIVELLDRYGTAPDVKGRLILDASDFADPAATLLFASASLDSPPDYTFRYNEEKGQNGRDEDYMGSSRNFLDHILISRSLLDRWDGKFKIDYFENRYSLSDCVRFSDHRPVSIRLSFPLSR